MSATKRTASDEPPEEGELDERPAKVARRDDPPPATGTNGAEEAAAAATPLPISHPFQARFRAAELSAGQYHVLDEAGSGDGSGAESAASDSDELDEDELMEMLDADLPEKFKGTRPVRGPGAAEDPDDDSNYEHRDKVVLKVLGRHPVEPLPEDWVQVTHMSGMPIYLHRQSRVVTLSRPYFLGPGSARKHDIPLYSVPCLQYLRELEKEGEQKADADPAPTCPVTGNRSACPASAGESQTQVNGVAEEVTENSTATNGEVTGVIGGAAVEAALDNTVTQDSETSAAGEAATESRPESDAVEDSAVEDSAAETDTAAATPAASTVPSPSESTQAGDESAAPTPAESAAPTPAESAAPTPAESAAPSPAAPAAEGEAPAAPGSNGVPVGPVPVDGVSMVDPSVTPEEMHKYCARRFQFKTIHLMKFNTWRERRHYLRKKRTQRPQMSSKTKLLSFPVRPSRKSAAVPGTRLREWVLNPGGKSYVCILHEYLQHVLREQPVYSYSELKNAATPYGATVSLNSVQYGSGYGSSKKQAKSEAAKATLQIFIPNLMEQIEADKTVQGSAKPADMDLSFFDSIRLEDPRVADLCSKAAEPSPFTILLVCLQRNFGLTSNQVACKLHTTKHKQNEFEMTVGKHTARVPCKNKKDGKHLAAQSLLQQLHPHVTSWGSLLRMYGNHSSKSLKVKRQEEQQITLLQSKATVNSPNYAILNKLREEMGKLQERQVRPIGLLQLSDLHEAEQGRSESGVTLDAVDL
ncbi:Microprocessor complex subunit DGCR8 [Amphibalanus amphitrite]|uniref:Microprocessor complex subunit DGCR8 n=1 Tax=Amphibalanus amphitrite TaxID=1232801 RepID=A0A6A4VU60_AMPAM|nr:Microprocessor complex subunit DGCR8 [Amphibalanus amphitrite]